jgi:hypothetical protein
LIGAAIAQSMNPPCWRPVRAALVLAATEPAKGHRWMTPAEAEAWILRHFPPNRQVRGYGIDAAVGISKNRRRSILDGALVHKAEAMAMAHYGVFGRDRPLLEDSSPAAFSEWFTANFANARAVGAAIDRTSHFLTERMVGFSIERGVRVPRLADAGTIRALDWLLRVGPHVPYGDRLGVAFPGQGEAP